MCVVRFLYTDAELVCLLRAHVNLSGQELVALKIFHVYLGGCPELHDDFSMMRLYFTYVLNEMGLETRKWIKSLKFRLYGAGDKYSSDITLVSLTF